MKTKNRSPFYNLLRAYAAFVLRANWNSGFACSIEDFKVLLNEAKERVQIVAGELDHKVFESDEVLEAIRAAIKRSVQIEILYGPEIDEETKRIFKLEEQNGNLLKIIKLKERSPAHFVTVDGGRFIRIEEFHKYNEPERRAYRVKGAHVVGSILQDEFNLLKETNLNS